jgi:hypothetical protein
MKNGDIILSWWYLWWIHVLFSFLIYSFLYVVDTCTLCWRPVLVFLCYKLPRKYKHTNIKFLLIFNIIIIEIKSFLWFSKQSNKYQLKLTQSRPGEITRLNSHKNIQLNNISIITQSRPSEIMRLNSHKNIQFNNISIIKLNSLKLYNLIISVLLAK